MEYFFIAGFLIISSYMTYLMIRLNREIRILEDTIDRVLTVLGRVSQNS